jgi:hypothetical protein
VGVGVVGDGYYGVYGSSSTGIGVYGKGTSGAPGVAGESDSGSGVEASSVTGAGVYGLNTNSALSTSPGVYGESTHTHGNGVAGIADSGTLAYAVYGHSTSGFAGRFFGKVDISGNLSKTSGSFKIDHPLDPANKYLYHSFVESPDMMNVYNGNVVTNERGYATVTMPDWFEALNRDFRYQLTIVDEADSDDFVQVKVVHGVADNQFTIRTSAPNVKVSWQVTGIRQDVWANAHRIQVEEDKADFERGYYVCPELYGLPAELSLDRAKERLTQTPTDK